MKMIDILIEHAGASSFKIHSENHQHESKKGKSSASTAPQKGPCGQERE